MQQREKKNFVNQIFKDFLVLIFLYSIQGILIVLIIFNSFSCCQMNSNIIVFGLIFAIIIWLVRNICNYRNYSYGVHSVILIF
ncbi:MAG: hypothetical protein PWP31_1179 [Clostridia bacterium]|nr:hypothetical protein [Clostridia bacterium]